MPQTDPSRLHFEEDAPDSGGTAYFPAGYVHGLLNFIRSNPTDLNLLTYEQFPWAGDFDLEANYPLEHRAWKTALTDGRFDKSKAHIVLHYDVDSAPTLTLDLVQSPHHRGLPAAIMVFNRRVDRRRLQHSGTLAYTDYEINQPVLLGLKQEGFVIGYHCNAYEQSLFDTQKALEIFNQDMRSMVERFGTTIMSAHGGVAGPNGLNNRDLPMPSQWRNSLHWVHNGHSPFFDAQYSDGGHNSLLRDPASRDLRDFVKRFEPGKRYRILLHPQYYAQEFKHSQRYAGTPWYEEVVALSRSSSCRAMWSEVQMGATNNRTMIQRSASKTVFVISKAWKRLTKRSPV